jgi:uncharacterized C2H2 Zn-finger protein
MDLECQRCGYMTKFKQSLIRHLEKKKECNIINNDISRDLLIRQLTEKIYNDVTYNCTYCDKLFNTSSNLTKHKKICKKNPENNLIIQVQQLTNKLNEQQITIEKIMNQPIHSSNNTQNIQNNININVPSSAVKLKNFGWENMNALPESLIASLFLELRFRDLVEQLHCDPDYPENHNIRIKSTKRNIMEIYRNDKWDMVSFVNGLNDLLLHGHKIFIDYYNKNKKRILEEDMTPRELNEALEQLENIKNLNKDEIKPIITELQLVLEEHREKNKLQMI